MCTVTTMRVLAYLDWKQEYYSLLTSDLPTRAVSRPIPDTLQSSLYGMYP